MSYASLFVHRVRVYRRTGTLDRFGQPVVGEGSHTLVGEHACRLNEKSGGEAFTERSRDVIQETGTLFVLAGVDIREDDQVEIFDPRNDYVLVSEGNVKQLRRVYDSRSWHHTEATIHVVRGSERG